jgi:hypothetical protein
MKPAREFFVNTLVGGLLVVVPIYLAVLLLLKAMKSVAALVRPLAKLLPPSLPFKGRDFKPQGAPQNFLSVSDCPGFVALAPVRSGPAGGDAD